MTAHSVAAIRASMLPLSMISTMDIGSGADQ
jgi:hypothetical protein